MDAVTAIKGSLDMAEMIGMAYVGDLTDAELMQRPHPDCNHLNWQLGHLICSEHALVRGISENVMPELPEGFAAMYTKEAASSDNPSHFATKHELLEVYRSQRDGTLALLAACSAADLDEPTGVDYAPTRGDLLRMQGEHWLMHCGQWVVVRRQHGKPIAI